MHSQSRLINDIYLRPAGSLRAIKAKVKPDCRRPRAPWAALPQDLGQIWAVVDSLPEPERARWQCAMSLAWGEGARTTDLVDATLRDFDLDEPSWNRPLASSRGRFFRSIQMSAESADAVARLAAISGNGRLASRGCQTYFRIEFSRIARRAGLPQVSFASIREAAKAHLFADRSISDDDFYGIYPPPGMWRVRAARQGETRHDRGH